MNDAEAKVLAQIDEDQIAADLAALVSIPSVDGSDAEHEVQAWCAQRLGELGLDVDHWRIELADLRQDPEFPGMEVEREEAWGCVGTWQGAEPDEWPALILNGHVDVVPPGDLELWPNHDPFTLRLVDGEWWGRGANDMKGGVAAILGAVAALKRAGVRPRRSLAVHTVVGEEDGGLGTYATLLRGHTGDTCVIAEPTNHDIVSANAGSLTFRIIIQGQSTHGSRRTTGVSAIEKFEVVHAALRELELDRNEEIESRFAHLDLGWPISVGIISAGDWASTVPDRCTIEGRYGVMPGESVVDAKAAFFSAVMAACMNDPWLREHPVELTWPGGLFAPGQLIDGHPLLEQVQRAAVDAGAALPKAIGGPYGSDLRQYAAVGVPTLQYGPGDARYAHSIDERVAVDDVLHCAKTYALMALRECG
ncbi:ArgE/DapE family deacylase [Solicola gregarius]|uniref:ArgE/DapE family deacylase n=1 Tax=Solicola gregarius TaxID=2908642 RepID=A0AA46TK53_9ACTN|nr:ArgE/DapE family deacylase [Solicola gregarius]UYM06771.1 ArgE/DapE family deacylase [Solicola gregarius]